VGRSSPVTPRVWTRGICTSLLARLSAPSASSRSPRRPRSRGQRHSPPVSLSLVLIIFSASPPLLRRAHALASRHLWWRDSTQCSASFPASPSSCWLRLPSLGKPALSSLSRAHLVGAPPWSPVSWPGLCSPPFLLVLVPKATPCYAGARRDLLSPGLRPETPEVGRTPPPCRHSRGQGP